MPSNVTAVIAGSGASSLMTGMAQVDEFNMMTPYGDPSSSIVEAIYQGNRVFVLYRHGSDHEIPPHKINYRANIWALSEINVNAVIAIATVGGISPRLKPGTLMLPDQLIDYTWGRESTFYDGEDGLVGHLEMTTPYCSSLRQLIRKAAGNRNIDLVDQGVYAIAQGPRFETPAEINRMENDGADVVGMTGMPEAALAAEKSLCYACLNFVVNPAAGRGDGEIGMDDIRKAWNSGQANLNELLAESLALIGASDLIRSESSVLKMQEQ